MIPVLVDGVKKYLLTEEEVDAKISASGGGSSSEITIPVFYGPLENLPTGDKWLGKICLHLQTDSSDLQVRQYLNADGNGYRWASVGFFKNDM